MSIMLLTMSQLVPYKLAVYYMTAIIIIIIIISQFNR